MKPEHAAGTTRSTESCITRLQTFPWCIVRQWTLRTSSCKTVTTWSRSWPQQLWTRPNRTPTNSKTCSSLWSRECCCPWCACSASWATVWQSTSYWSRLWEEPSPHSWRPSCPSMRSFWWVSLQRTKYEKIDKTKERKKGGEWKRRRGRQIETKDDEKVLPTFVCDGGWLLLLVHAHPDEKRADTTMQYFLLAESYTCPTKVDTCKRCARINFQSIFATPSASTYCWSVR